MTNTEQADRPGDLPVAWLLFGAVTFAATAALIPAVTVWLYSGHAPIASLPQLAVGTARIITRGAWADPASAFPAQVAAQMPTATGWWAATLRPVALTAAAVTAALRRLEPLAATNRLGRRPYDPRGRKPRSWARPRDLTPLIVPRPQPGRFTLGRVDRRLLASHPEAHVAVIAPTRSGKTTRCVIPWLLEHHGPAIVTSTKTDILHATRAHRSTLGRVHVWDPFGPSSAGWTPLDGCRTWTGALQGAQWLSDAVTDGDSEVARYWRGEAAKLLAPLLHAAALDQRRIDTVLNWLDGQETATALRILEAHDADDAARQLGAVTALDDRNRGTTYMSAGSLLAAYRYPEVTASAHPELTPDALLDGAPNTLYIVASERHQRLLTPLVVSLLSSVLHHAAAHANTHGPLDPALRVLIDEAANIAPLRDLPGHLSQAAGYGIRIATIWQSVAQIRERYHHAADSILANSTTKLFMGPVTDEATRRYITTLLGDETSDSADLKASTQRSPRSEVKTFPRSKATAAALQQLQPDRALAIDGAQLPTLMILRPYWQGRPG